MSFTFIIAGVVASLVALADMFMNEYHLYGVGGAIVLFSLPLAATLVFLLHSIRYRVPIVLRLVSGLYLFGWIFFLIGLLSLALGLYGWFSSFIFIWISLHGVPVALLN